MEPGKLLLNPIRFDCVLSFFCIFGFCKIFLQFIDMLDSIAFELEFSFRWLNSNRLMIEVFYLVSACKNCCCCLWFCKDAREMPIIWLEFDLVSVPDNHIRTWQIWISTFALFYTVGTLESANIQINPYPKYIPSCMSDCIWPKNRTFSLMYTLKKLKMDIKFRL